jgi:two-component system, sensor histidine kinase
MPQNDPLEASVGPAQTSSELEAREQAVARREQILAEVSHELRNSLNGVALATNVLDQQVQTPSQRITVARIAKGVRRALRILENLLTDSVIESGSFALEPGAIDPAEVVLQAVETQQDAGAAASVVIAADLTPALPRIQVDSERLLEVFDNLIGNALKFTAAGGTIEVGAARREGSILFWVKDSGTGIPSDQLSRIFDRYWRAKARNVAGTGLGLSICKAVVEAHGGRIWAESTEGLGTTVLFTIPSEEPPAGTEHDVPFNILIVDDRAENRLALAAILEQPGYRIVMAASGQEALRAALHENFSIILLDIEMPEIDGFEVAAHLKLSQRTKAVPIVFVTAHGDDSQQIYRAYAAGAADYLVKPLDPEVVRRKVAVFAELGRSRAR